MVTKVVSSNRHKCKAISKIPFTPYYLPRSILATIRTTIGTAKNLCPQIVTITIQLLFSSLFFLIISLA